MSVKLGDLVYRGVLAWLRLPGNTSTTKKFLAQTGDGSASAAPVWATVGVGDLPDSGPILTADPVSPSDDTYWVIRDGASPESVSLNVRIDGVTYSFPIGSLT